MRLWVIFSAEESFQQFFALKWLSLPKQREKSETFESKLGFRNSSTFKHIRVLVLFVNEFRIIYIGFCGLSEAAKKRSVKQNISFFKLFCFIYCRTFLSFIILSESTSAPFTILIQIVASCGLRCSVYWVC